MTANTMRARDNKTIQPSKIKSYWYRTSGGPRQSLLLQIDSSIGVVVSPALFGVPYLSSLQHCMTEPEFYCMHPALL